MPLSIIWIFLKLGLFHEDSETIDEYLHREIVVKNQIMSEEEFNKVHSIGKMSMFSYKMTYAYSVGKVKGNLLLGVTLSLVTLLPSCILFFALLYLLLEKGEPSWLLYISNGVAPVLAAYFLYSALQLLKKGYTNFPLFPFILLCIIGFVLVFVLQWPIALILAGTLFLFLCFMKGGNING